MGGNVHGGEFFLSYNFETLRGQKTSVFDHKDHDDDCLKLPAQDSVFHNSEAF